MSAMFCENGYEREYSHNRFKCAEMLLTCA